MGLLDKVQAARGAKSSSWRQRDFWEVDRLGWPSWGSSTLRSNREQVESNFEGYVCDVLMRNGPIAALMFVRQHVFAEARLQYRRFQNGRPGNLFGDTSLAILEKPWPNGTTGDLLARMIQDADLAGNAYLTIINGHVRRLRPDWVTIISGSREHPEQYGAALDAEIIGYLYSPQLRGTDLVGGSAPTGTTLLLPEQVAHFAPIPDPLANWRGMSWITPVLREVSSDLAATTHKMNFFRNGASPQFAVQFDASVTPEMARDFRELMEAGHTGVDNAYRTLYLGGGADVTPLTMDMRQLDFKTTQGAGESRLAAAAGVPPVIVGFSEGLAGSSLNAGNYNSSRRRMADATMRPLWRNAAASLSTLVTVPAGAELWFDDRDIAFLREDEADRAAIFVQKMAAIESGIRGGYTPESLVAAVAAYDETLLEHTGLYSVQLLPPSEGTSNDYRGPTPPEALADPAAAALEEATAEAAASQPPAPPAQS